MRITASPNAQEPTKQIPVKVKKKPLDALLDATIHRHVELFSHMKDMVLLSTCASQIRPLLFT